MFTAKDAQLPFCQNRLQRYNIFLICANISTGICEKNDYLPCGLQQVSMDAQWMLKGCSMVACPNLSTLS